MNQTEYSPLFFLSSMHYNDLFFNDWLLSFIGTSTRPRRVEACQWACRACDQQPITWISRPGHRSKRFDWLELVLAYDLIGWRFRRRLKSWTFLNFRSEQWRQSDATEPQCSSAKRDVTSFKVNGKTSPLKHVTLPRGRTVTGPILL